MSEQLRSHAKTEDKLKRAGLKETQEKRRPGPDAGLSKLQKSAGNQATNAALGAKLGGLPPESMTFEQIISEIALVHYQMSQLSMAKREYAEKDDYLKLLKKLLYGKVNIYPWQSMFQPFQVRPLPPDYPTIDVDTNPAPHIDYRVIYEEEMADMRDMIEEGETLRSSPMAAGTYAARRLIFGESHEEAMYRANEVAKCEELLNAMGSTVQAKHEIEDVGRSLRQEPPLMEMVDKYKTESPDEPSVDIYPPKNFGHPETSIPAYPSLPYRIPPPRDMTSTPQSPSDNSVQNNKALIKETDKEVTSQEIEYRLITLRKLRLQKELRDTIELISTKAKQNPDEALLYLDAFEDYLIKEKLISPSEQYVDVGYKSLLSCIRPSEHEFPAESEEIRDWREIENDRYCLSNREMGKVGEEELSIWQLEFINQGYSVEGWKEQKRVYLDENKRKDSSIPELFHFGDESHPPITLEAKNFLLSTSDDMELLISKVTGQATKRDKAMRAEFRRTFPKRKEVKILQYIFIDLRGQDKPPDDAITYMLQEFEERSGGLIAPDRVRFKFTYAYKAESGSLPPAVEKEPAKWQALEQGELKEPPRAAKMPGKPGTGLVVPPGSVKPPATRPSKKSLPERAPEEIGKVRRIRNEDLIAQQKAVLARKLRESRIGRIQSREDKAARLEADKAELGFTSDDPTPISFRSWKEQGREDRQGALRRLAYETDPKIVPPEVAANLRGQLKNFEKLMSEGRFDETKHQLRLPKGYVLGHWEGDEFMPETPKTPSREGFDCNNARVITEAENRREERLRRQQEQKEKAELAAQKTSKTDETKTKSTAIPPIIRKKGKPVSTQAPGAGTDYEKPPTNQALGASTGKPAASTTKSKPLPTEQPLGHRITPASPKYVTIPGPPVEETSDEPKQTSRHSEVESFLPVVQKPTAAKVPVPKAAPQAVKASTQAVSSEKIDLPNPVAETAADKVPTPQAAASVSQDKAVTPPPFAEEVPSAQTDVLPPKNIEPTIKAAPSSEIAAQSADKSTSPKIVSPSTGRLIARDIGPSALGLASGILLNYTMKRRAKQEEEKIHEGFYKLEQEIMTLPSYIFEKLLVYLPEAEDLKNNNPRSHVFFNITLHNSIKIVDGSVGGLPGQYFPYIPSSRQEPEISSISVGNNQVSGEFQEIDSKPLYPTLNEVHYYLIVPIDLNDLTKAIKCQQTVLSEQ